MIRILLVSYSGQRLIVNLNDLTARAVANCLKLKFEVMFDFLRAPY
jgi:hypothetical protein